MAAAYISASVVSNIALSVCHDHVDAFGTLLLPINKY